MVQIREHHNAIVDCLHKAVRYGNTRIEQQIPGIDSEYRPDLVIEGNDQVTIYVTCPFDNGEDVLSTADFNKVTKYDHLKQHFSRVGIKCNMFGFMICALGTWNLNNEAVLNQLPMYKTYKSLFRKLCCSDAVQGSAELYYRP